LETKANIFDYETGKDPIEIQNTPAKQQESFSSKKTAGFGKFLTSNIDSDDDYSEDEIEDNINELFPTAKKLTTTGQFSSQQKEKTNKSAILRGTFVSDDTFAHDDESYDVASKIRDFSYMQKS